MMKRVLILVLIFLALSGCSKSAASADMTATVAAPTAAAFPSLPAMTPTSSASPTPFTPFTVKPGVDNLNVRMNPGYLFDALMVVQQADTLTVQGKAPGGEWIAVKTADGVEGWVFAELLKSDVNLEQVPVRVMLVDIAHEMIERDFASIDRFETVRALQVAFETDRAEALGSFNRFAKQRVVGLIDQKGAQIIPVSRHQM